MTAITGWAWTCSPTSWTCWNDTGYPRRRPAHRPGHLPHQRPGPHLRRHPGPPSRALQQPGAIPADAPEPPGPEPGPSVPEDDLDAVTLTHAEVRTVLTSLDLAAD